MIKILDYTEPLDETQINISQKVLWPAYEYGITVKGIPEFGDNILESLILQLVSLNIRDSGTVANKTGLDIELVGFLQSRLLHKGFVDESMNITENGKAKLEQREKTTPQHFYVYKDAISGKIISRLVPLDAEKKLVVSLSHEKNIDETNIKCFCFKANSTAGNEALLDVELPMFSVKILEYNLPKLKIEEVEKAVLSCFPPEMCGNVMVDIGDDAKPKLVYFVLDIVLPRGNTRDFVIYDEGMPDSFFTNSLNFLNPDEQKFISLLRDKLQHTILDEATQANANSNFRNYPKVEERLFSLLKKIPDIKTKAYTSDDEKRLLQLEIDFVKEIYQMLEWAFFYKLKESEIIVKGALANIQKLSPHGNSHRYVVGNYVCKIAKNIGFDLDKDASSCLNIKLGSIKHSLKASNDHEMWSLVAMAICCAKDNYNHWMKKIAETNSDFLILLAGFKHLRDAAIHSNEVAVTFATLEKYFELAKICIGILLGLKVKEDEKFATYTQLDFIEEDNILNGALKKMENDLGFALKNSLPDNFSSIFLLLEKCSLDDKEIKPAVVLHQYQLLEKIFEQFIAICSRNKKVNAIEKASEAGFVLNEEDKVFCSKIVNKERIENVIEGKSASMQACFVAWIMIERKDVLMEIRRITPKIFEVVRKVANFRGHGEIPESGYTNDELKMFTEYCFALLKFLGDNGYFSGKSVN